MSEVMDTPPPSQTGPEHNVIFNEAESRFQITLDGELVNISPLQAVCFVLQSRYVAMSGVTAEKTREMQQQIKLINEANGWLNAVTDGLTDSFTKPQGASGPLRGWMGANGLDTNGIGEPPDKEDLKKAQGIITNYVDQLSSTNDLRMLSLKTAVNKAQQALTAADGVLQNIKQLMNTLVGNLAR